MTEFNSFPDAPQSERGAYHHFTRSVTLLNRVLQIFCGPMTQMSPRKGEQPTENHKSARQRHAVPLSLRSCACKPIFRSALPCIFQFQHVCVCRIAGSKDFRLGKPSGQRITGAIKVLLSLLLAPKSLILRRDRRKRISFPD